MDILPPFTSCASIGDIYLSDYSPSDVKWDKHRGNTEAIGAIYATNPAYSRFAYRMAACSTLLGFSRGIDTDTGESKIKLQKAMFCKVRNCPTCAWRRSLRNTARFFSKLPELQAKFPSHRWLFLTLTIPNCYPDQLREYLNRMNKAWQRLIQRKDWPSSGWVRATEVTRGDDGSAHPHFHVLLMVPASYFSGRNYVTQDEWLNRWRDAMRDNSITQVDIRAVKPKREGQTIQAAIVETLKYATKVEDGLNHPDWLFIITAQLHKLRFLASGGELKGILKEEMNDKEMISGDDQITETPLEADLFFGWKSEAKRYVKK